VESDTKLDRIETGHGFGRIAVDEDAIWIANTTSETVARIDRRSGRVDRLTELRHATSAIARGTEAIWVLGANGWLWRFYPDGEGEGVARTGRGGRDVVCDPESAWVLHGNGGLVAIDQSTGEARVETKIPRGGRQILQYGDALIALTGNGRRVVRIAKEGSVEDVAKLPARGLRATLDGNSLWVACGRLRSSRWGALVRVDLVTMQISAIYELSNAPRAITAGAGHVWVACGRRGDKKSAVVRVEPTSGETTPWAKTDWTIYDLAVAGDELLAACGVTLAGPAAGIGDGGGGGGTGGGHHGGGGGGHGGGGSGH
jgi:hypothetical protein